MPDQTIITVGLHAELVQRDPCPLPGCDGYLLPVHECSSLYLCDWCTTSFLPTPTGWERFKV